jgi:outer membrane biosynthesis protein TonB
METQIDKNRSLTIKLKLKSRSVKIRGGIFSSGRYLIGRTETCDLLINSEAVSTIHAVLEVKNNLIYVYDMNSTNGSYVDGEKIIAKQVKMGSTISFANVEFVLEEYQETKDLPPVLETLAPDRGNAAPSKKPPIAPKVSQSGEIVPALVFPLALDPRADKSEYIFEDSENLYPIFKYDYSKQAAEVIILHNERVYSFDHIPSVDGEYSLVGMSSKEADLEFPYLGKTEKVSFIEVRAGQVSVHKLFGYDIFMLSDQKEKTVNQLTGLIELKPQDIVRFSKGSIQIYVRLVEAPPKVKSAPIIKRDPLLRKNLLLGTFIGFLASVIILFSQFENTEEKKEELAPERLATILYKQKLTISKEKAVEKTPDKPKVIQKAPPKVAVKPPEPEKVPQPDVKKPDIKEIPKPTVKEAGDIKAPTKQVVKKGETQKPDKRLTNNSSAPPKPSSSTLSNNKPKSFSKVNLNTAGPVDVYKSADFSSSINTLMAKGGSLEGIKTQGVSGSSGNLAGGISSGSGSSTGTLKKAEIGSNVGSLTGNTKGIIGTSKGAEGLSAKKGIYTAGIPAETVVLGSMDPDIIRKILLDHLPQFRYCYQSELDRTGSEVQGTIKLDFNIGASGHVTSAGVDDSNLSTDVKKCVVKVLRGIQFPEPLGGGTVEVKQPMNFYSKKL